MCFGLNFHFGVYGYVYFKIVKLLVSHLLVFLLHRPLPVVFSLCYGTFIHDPGVM